MQPNVVDLIRPLIRATVSHKIRWELDPSGGYLARFGSNAVNVYTEPAPGLRVVSADGTIIDWLDDAGMAENLDDLAELFELADRQFRNVDHVLADILHQLGEDAAVAH